MKSYYKVAYATGSRADYGIVRNYLKKLDSDPNVQLSLLVTGTHLEKSYGYTISQIDKDGFNIAFQANINIDSRSNASIIKSMSIALSRFGTFFETNHFDLLIILGDRYEMLAVSTAAAIQRIPILHLHGGEATYGNYDEFIRHSITKMSTFHFTSTDKYRKRVIQLGEDPNRVFNLGALGAENCKMIDEENIDQRVKTLPNRNYFVIAFHPETLTNISIEKQANNILSALDAYDNRIFVFIGTNADTGSSVIRKKWMDYTTERKNAYYFENLGSNSYLYLVKHSIALVGNSSSGIIEAPSLGVCTVNIGRRQDGRVFGNSVFNVECESSEIINAMHNAEQFADIIDNPYYYPNTADNYYKQTKELLKRPISVVKTFYDV